MKENRKFGEYYLDEYSIKESENPCHLCELTDKCDQIADDLNKIDYCICLEYAKKYKETHPNAYYKKIN